ncbi:hypothetical protein [Yinghuangia soli]|uniref:Uncharacterized protein n=1 Tax=Yinghuangia soli TaxID=2908204 RepID=A0AA41U3V8_9ACTN|nr:hypothetical protein [Yinghuangia soli]MCF2532230.1 hypothetical protein [Yinghuangia soli]
MDDAAFWAQWPKSWVGTERDVRTVSAAMSQETKDGFRYDAIPWHHCRLLIPVLDDLDNEVRSAAVRRT